MRTTDGKTQCAKTYVRKDRYTMRRSMHPRGQGKRKFQITAQSRRPNKHNIELNKCIVKMKNMHELCALIGASSAEFDHVNVATAFRKVLQLLRGGVPPEPVTKALQKLKESALQNMQEFGAREIANTQHIMAKERYKPRGHLLLAFEGRAEAISGEFDSQGFANTLWAYSKMGRQPGQGLMRKLEEQAEELAHKFNSQDVANTLWAYATLGRQPGEGLMRKLEEKAEGLVHKFSPQNVANTLWAYATLRRQPGEGLTQKLEEQAEGLALAREFNSQEVANTLWAYATLGRQPDADAGGAGGRACAYVQRAGSCEHAVGICDAGKDVGGGLDAEVGGAGGNACT
jgi:hypothetical protein